MISDAPLEDVRRDAGLELGQATIDDVLFERSRNRRAASEMGPGGTPLAAQVGRRARTEQIAAGRSLSQAQLIGAANRGTGRGDATVEAARINGAFRVLASDTATPEAKAAAQAIIDGQQAGGAAVPGAAQGGEPSRLQGAMASGSDAARQMVLDTFRLRQGPDGLEFPEAEDFQRLGDISAPWFRADKSQIAVYKGAANRVVDLVGKANSLEGDARAVALDLLNRTLVQNKWNDIDMTNLGGDYAALVRQKRRIQEAVARMQDGTLSPEDIDDLRRIGSVESDLDARSRRAASRR